MPRTRDPSKDLAVGYGGHPYSGYFPITASAPPYPSTSLEPAIQGLITPGLVPDIARQSAEVAAGRGVSGSPAGASTAVRMSEQDYLQRLGLANTLLSGEASRTLPYQITPYQSAQLQNQRDIAGQRWPGDTGGGGGGQRPAGGVRAPNYMDSPWGAGADVAYSGTRPISDVITNWTPGWKPSTGFGGPPATGNMLPLYPGGPVVGGLDEMVQSLVGEEGVDPILGVPYNQGFGDLGLGGGTAGSPDLGYLNE